MRKHNGMRPQDIVVLLKILCIKDDQWQFKDLAAHLYLSPSEISESLFRSHVAGLIDESRRKVFRRSLYEFIIYGLHYVFPQRPGAIVNGLPTAHAHPFFEQKLSSDMAYVWPDPNGKVRGCAIEPLYAGVVAACKQDEQLYKLLALIDVIRVGKVRELKITFEELKTIILDESSAKHHTYQGSL